jgi:eukaryotic-like serine/threonine-protein kinase
MGDRYTITERVDQGGMAEVFRGVAESLQGFKKSVAIKRILPSLTKNKKFVSMFLDEAKLSLHLQHTNIVHVFDIGVADSAYFIVMEYVDGCNLKSLLEFVRRRNRRIQVAHCIYIMIEVCKGLSYAHDAQDPETMKPLGIVHRDISPPNILLSKMGEVKLVDFGLAKATSQAEITDPGVVKGKFSYLSPEAASGIEVDSRADLFAVGILLWEMLTGKRLFYGETDYQTVELVRQSKIPSLQALNPEIDGDLEGIVRRALARDPRDRFQHAADLQEALAQHLFSHGMKVTSRDIAKIVRDVATERELDKGRASGPQKSLIDALIREEMNKFTSIDDLGQAGAAGAAPLSPEEVAGFKNPLDPGSFVDTRDWADDIARDPAMQTMPQPPPPSASASLAASKSGGRVPIVSIEREEPTEPVSQSQTSQTKKATRPRNSEPLDSLEQMLEPERISSSRSVQPPVPQNRTSLYILIALVLLGLIGTGVVVFKDAIFGSNTELPKR